MPTSQMINLQEAVDNYKKVLQNTQDYRKVWDDSLKDNIINGLKELVNTTGLDADVKAQEKVSNLEAVELSLGQIESGLSQKVSEEIGRPLIKFNGSLVYQQLFNGKVIVMIRYPFIEGYGQPRPPRTIAIYRPEEIKPGFYANHMQEFLEDVTTWEDYDDDEPHKKIGFNLNFDQHRPGGTAQ